MDQETTARNRLEHMLLDGNAEPTYLPLSLLTAITNDFSEDREIGSGGFAVVYKGMLQNGTVAVKRLSDALDMDEMRFNREIECLMRVKHKNIVRFFGYCADTQGKLVHYEGRHVMADHRQRLLCFEYVPRGSLYNYISDASRGLAWRTRYQIIRGICEGLDYLHENHIVHLDLKPANVLLDYNMVPKICDFDNSRFFHDHQTREIREKTLSGSVGYLAPESFNGVITVKMDIYALGIIMAEILTGQKGYTSVVLVLDSWRNQLERTSGQDTPLLEQIRVCAEICISCMDYDPEKRPEIKNIIKELHETESVMPYTKSTIEMLNDTEGMDEFMEAGIRTSSTAKMPPNGAKEGTPTISRVETSEITELNILERIVAEREEPSHLDLPLLYSITESFSKNKRIGKGGCGEVYKGILRNADVAVKRLFNNRTIKDKMFHREVKGLITVRHKNIVRFLGYCSFTEERAIPVEGQTVMVEIRERLLCFECISNGSLERHIADELRGLEWHTRFDIIVGICKGLCYLHKEKNITHMDLKPANILLDDHMVPKITDFGLSRLDNDSQATSTTSRLISPGYSAPEYLSEGKSSKKSDIYSLGVIILELVSGSINNPNITKAQVLRKWRHRWSKSSKHTPMCYQQVTKCFDLAHKCMERDPRDRPDISNLVQELNEIDSNKDDKFQVIPSLEDMLGIEPLEIQFPFEVYWEVSHTVELSNDTDDHFAFLTKPSLHRLRTEPAKGIVPPGSMCSITVTMVQAQFLALANYRYKEEITVLSTRVDGGLAAVDITKDMFTEKDGRVVDEVNVVVILGRPPSEEES